MRSKRAIQLTVTALIGSTFRNERGDRRRWLFLEAISLEDTARDRLR